MKKSIILNLNNISYKLSEMEKPIINGISYTIYTGDFVVLLGGNGSGKSTLIKLLNRTTRVTNGEISLNGNPLESINNKCFANKMVSLNQDMMSSLFYDLSVLENCLVWDLKSKTRDSFNKIDIRKFYKQYLKNYHPKLEEKLDDRVKFLSGGEKQALILALCLKNPPEILLLDEHTSALDPIQTKHIMMATIKAIQRLKITCIMTTHDLGHALAFGNRLLAIKEGKIIFQAEAHDKKNLKMTDIIKLCF